MGMHNDQPGDTQRTLHPVQVLAGGGNLERGVNHPSTRGTRDRQVRQRVEPERHSTAEYRKPVFRSFIVFTKFVLESVDAIGGGQIAKRRPVAVPSKTDLLICGGNHLRKCGSDCFFPP